MLSTTYALGELSALTGVMGAKAERSLVYHFVGMPSLPTGLDPDPSANGHANALFYDWQFSGDNEEYLDPARYQYREFFILLDALYEGKPVSYCPYIFVDNDAAIARGWTHGYPKRLGKVFQTRYYAATGRAGPALAPGSKFAGSVTASGQRFG